MPHNGTLMAPFNHGLLVMLSGKNGPMDPSTSDLIADLDDPSGAAEEARLDLIARGDTVVGPIIAALPTLARFGQLTAIEVLRELRAHEAGPALISLLGSEHETVRDWAAQALGDLGVTEAVPDLKTAYRATRQRNVPLDYTEPLSLRWALTQLGGRTEVLPAIAARYMTTASSGLRLWPTEQLSEVLRDLAAHDQAVLFVQTWRPKDGNVYWQRTGLDWTTEIDFTRPWTEIISQTLEWGELLSQSLQPDDELLASVVWIDRSDL